MTKTHKTEYRATTGEIFRQVGNIAYKDNRPTRPIFELIQPEEINPKTKLTQAEEQQADAFAEELLTPFERYVQECEKRGIKP